MCAGGAGADGRRCVCVWGGQTAASACTASGFLARSAAPCARYITRLHACTAPRCHGPKSMSLDNPTYVSPGICPYVPPRIPLATVGFSILPIAYYELSIAYYKLSIAYYELSIAYYELSIANYEVPVAYYELPNAYCELPNAYCELPIAYCELPNAYCELPNAYNDLPIAYCKLPNAYCKLPNAYCELPRAAVCPEHSACWCVAQVVEARRWLASEGAQSGRPAMPIANVVFMGMGEPLHNMDAVLAAVDVLADPAGLMLSRNKIVRAGRGPSVCACARAGA
eukprot:364930-Chlamydomonas_euryale.AAC.26